MCLSPDQFGFSMIFLFLDANTTATLNWDFGFSRIYRFWRSSRFVGFNKIKRRQTMKYPIKTNKLIFMVFQTKENTKSELPTHKNRFYGELKHTNGLINRRATAVTSQMIIFTVIQAPVVHKASYGIAGRAQYVHCMILILIYYTGSRPRSIWLGHEQVTSQ